ncbi:phosphotransferase [Actinoalloteichus hymeniacidonis]|nr:phosphotransferase [Actinoalloteichus hymeniacidonis]MBB5907695.1 spectinomycin phosphotransferase [Actinoalloteichus hymeniacidonis]
MSADHRQRGEAPLAEWIRADFGIDLVSIESVDQGADRAAQVRRGIASDGARYAIKWTTGGSRAGLTVPNRLADHGVPGVAGPIRTTAGGLYRERAGRRLSLTPWLSGDIAMNGAMTSEHWRSYGGVLAEAHAVPVDAELAAVLPREEYRLHEQYVAAVRTVQRGIDELDAAASRADRGDPHPAGLDDRLVQSLRAEWRASKELITSLTTQVEVLASDLRDRPTPRVICHGDPHLGNLLLRGADQVWLIDWDDTVLAPPELDLQFVLGGVLYFALVGEQEQSWFFDGYGPIEIDPARLAYYRCARALEDLVIPAAEVLDLDGFDRQARSDALAIVRGVLSPTGLATLAWGSLRELGMVAGRDS